MSSFSTRQQATVVTLTTNLKEIVHHTHTNASKTESPIESIIKDIACYIRAEMKQMRKEKEVYPEAGHMKDKQMNLDAVAQWLRASSIFRQICKSTSEWRGFESRWFYQLGFEFAKTLLNH